MPERAVDQRDHGGGEASGFGGGERRVGPADRGLPGRYRRFRSQIGWYLLVEPDLTDFESVDLRMFRLEGRDYIEHALVPFGAALTLDVPFHCEIDTRGLLDW